MAASKRTQGREPVTKAQGLIAKVEKKVDVLELGKLERRLNETLDRIGALSKDAAKMLDEAKIPDTSTAAREAFASADKNLKSFLRVQSELRLTMATLQESLGAIQELVQLIEEDPSALLRGKQGKKERDK